MGKHSRKDAQAKIEQDMKYAKSKTAKRLGSAGVDALEEMVMKEGVPFHLCDTTMRKEIDEKHEFARESIQGGWAVSVVGLPAPAPFSKPIDRLWTQEEMQAVLMCAYGKNGEDEKGFLADVLGLPWITDDHLLAERVVERYLRELFNRRIGATKAYDALVRGFTKERRQRHELIDSLGCVMAEAVVPDDDTIEVLNLDQWKAASSIQTSIDLVDDYANAVIKALGIDTPAYENALLKAQAEYLVDNHNDTVDLVCELVEEVSGGDKGPGTARFLAKEANRPYKN